MKNNNTSPSILEQAFRELYAIIYQATNRITQNEQDAKDITMNSFVKLNKKAGVESMTMEAIKAFLLTTVKNEAIDNWRKAQSKKGIQKSSLANEAQDYQEDWAYEELFATRSKLLQEVLSEITDRQREVLVLYYFDGKTAKEISERLDISIHTVRNTIADAIKSVRKKLERRGFKF